jgi:outer membrane protein assembly factor BamA
MQDYAAFRGYYGTTAKGAIRRSRRKAQVAYEVALAPPYRIRSIAYSFMDRRLDTSFIVDPARRLIKVGDIFDGEQLEAESNRVAGQLRNLGYYYFHSGYVTYRADTTAGSRQVDLTLVVAQHQAEHNAPAADHRRYYVKGVQLNSDYSYEKTLTDSAYATTGWDTVRRYDIDFVCKGCLTTAQRPTLRLSAAAASSAIKVGGLYSAQEVSRTYNNFANLRLFKSINIRLSELPADSLAADTAPLPLQASITLSPFLKQNYTWGGEVSLSGNGLFGATLSVGYQHKNLLRGAEILDANITGALQRVQVYADAAPENAYELGASVSINMPRFLVPMRLPLYQNTRSPRTQVLLAGNFQQRPDYTRVLATFNLGYSWRNAGSMTYILNPLDVNIIKVLEITPSFQDAIQNNPYMLYAYQNAFLLGATFSAIYNTREDARSAQHHLRFDVELKGNLLWLAYKAFDVSASDNSVVNSKVYEIWEMPFAQFAKFDLTYTSLNKLNSSSSVAFRALAGVGVAYGNTYSLPFDKMYYCGGANSMRGWQIRTLGPGSYSETSNFLNHLADMRLELNAEYRFKLVGTLEGAAFVDAGNIWSLSDDIRTDALFSWQRFPAQIAISWGLGIRFNFSVLVARLDYAIRLHDPALGGAYFRAGDFFSPSRNSIFLALGYPF